MTTIEFIKYKEYERLRNTLLATLDTNQLIMLNDMENAKEKLHEEMIQ